MSANPLNTRIEIEPLISYPKKAEAGKSYVMTVDLRQRATGAEWPYEDEEYIIHFMLDSMPLFNSEPIGDPSVVLHRFGGTYGPAMFILTANEEEMLGSMRLTLVNEWGVPVDVIEIPGVQVTAEEVESRASDVWFMKESTAATITAGARHETVEETAPPPTSMPAAPRGFRLRHTLREGKGETVGRITWSPDGKILVIPANDLQLWDAETGQLLRILKPDAKPNELLGRAMYSPNGELLAFGDGDKFIEIWETKGWSQLWVMAGQERWIHDLAWSPDSRRLASTSIAGTIKIWDARLGELLRSLEGQGEMLSVAWSPDGKRLASGSADNTIYIWEVSTGQALRTVEGHTGAVYSLAWSPDGQTLASGGGDHAIILWDAETGIAKSTIHQHDDYVIRLSFSADNRLLASKSSDGMVMIWRCDTWERLATLDEHSVGAWASSPAFHPTQPVLATLDEQHKVVQIWDLDVNTLLAAAPSTESLPPEVVEEGDEAIKEYSRQSEAEGIDYLYEAKLLIVGEGGAGKTSLARKIVNPQYEPAEEYSTRGIEAISWTFPMENGQPFRVNIWDFGGQEIYHATDQFFMTKRSLYLLVVDTRREVTDFYYWLSMIELLSDGSPVLIIKNEKQDRSHEINESQLRAQFPNLRGTLAVNLATNRGLDRILAEIKHHISQLPQVGAPLPKTWVKVRETLDRDARNYISLAEYFAICERNGFRERKDSLLLSDYLHDLGVCLHFQSDPILKKTVILKPKWGTDAVYKVLDNSAVIGNLGKFDRDDLASIWHEAEYANMQDELLQLMINFKLCYRIPNSEFYIAPQLLAAAQPTYDWDETNNLILRYTYEFMPKGIITQFIVAVHALIAEQTCVWKSGVVLKQDQTKAEVIEHYSRREIRIRVAGEQKKALLTIVEHELDKIHASYARLKYDKLVPCNCTQCKNSQEPHFYRLETLRRFIDDRQDLIQCAMSFEMVDVRGLIDDDTNARESLSRARNQVFISYSHRDEVEKERLLSHIRAALPPDLTNLWSDDRLVAGDDWEREMAEAMGEAKVAILFITANFLNSDFILQKQVKTLLERRAKEGLRIIPVIAKACAWKRVAWLGEMNVRPNNGVPIWSDGGSHVEEDLAIIAFEVADVIDKEQAHPPSEEAAETSSSPVVLVISDNTHFRRSVILNLHDMNTPFFEASSVKEGIKRLDDNQDVRIILLDLDLEGGGDGVELFEHIKDRASAYRVIVITDHDKLLSAERASSYNVFSYLSKSGKDAPLQTLRFTVMQAISDLKQQVIVRDQEFGEEALNRYPTPFTYIYNYLKSDSTLYETLVRQMDMLELLVHFSAVILLCEYLYGDARNEEFDTLIRSRIYKPSLGDWFSIINEILKRKNDLSKTFFLDSFLTFFTDGNKRTIEELIGVRNRYVGHSPTSSDYETRTIVERCDGMLTSLLRDYQFITHFLMCYPFSVQKIKPVYTYRLRECIGANPQLLYSERKFSFLMDANEMHLINLDTEQYRSLHPFIILENCDECKQPEIFFYSQFSNNQLRYVSYKTGHWSVKEEGAEDFLQ